MILLLSILCFLLQVLQTQSFFNRDVNISQNVTTIRKCCGISSIFDPDIGRCRSIGISKEEETFLDPFINEFANQVTNNNHSHGTVNFLVGVPQCNPKEQVLVTYQMTLQELHLQKHLPDDPFGDQRSLFCVEQSASSRETAWMVRICKPRSICLEMPCVRKCCDFHEMLIPVNNSPPAPCVPFEKDLDIRFYDLPKDHFPDDPAIVSVEGEAAKKYFNTPISYPTLHSSLFLEYGVLFRQRCLKYILHPADASEDRYYISHKNGDLHLAGNLPYGKRVTHNHYCVDHVSINGIVTQETFVCFFGSGYTKIFDWTTPFYPLGLCFSSVFLVLTIVVYGCSPKVNKITIL